MLNQYVAIDHGDTVPHSYCRILQLAHNDRMTKQSYVNLDQFFTIEASHLELWGKDKGEPVRQLDTRSIEALEGVFLDFITRPRPTRTSTIRSPLDYRPEKQLTAVWLGVNDTRFVKPSRQCCAIAIVAPPTPPPTPPSTPPPTSPPKYQLITRANGAQRFQMSGMGIMGK